MITATIFYQHTMPTPVIWVGIGVALVLLAWSFSRYLAFQPSHLLLALLRVLFFLALGWCLLMPMRKHIHTEVLRPRFLVLADASKSMALSPQPDIPNRWTEARRILGEPWTKAVGKEAEIDAYSFADGLSSKMDLAEVAKLVPAGESSLLRDNLRRMVDRYRGQPLAGLLLLSDGIDTREMYDQWASQEWPCPIYTVRLEPLEAWQIAPEVRVDRVDTPRRVVAGWDTKLTAVVSGQATKGQPITVRLLENDQPIQELPTQIPAEGGSREVVFHLEHPMVGNFTYLVQIPPLAGEVQTNDNAYAVSVQVIDTKNRLLYVEGVPRWESKYLTRALRSIQDITPLTFLRGPDNTLLTLGQRGSMTVDLTPEQLAQYKIVILGDLDTEFLTEARTAAIVKFVEDGGSLVLLGGPTAWGPKGFAATGLARLLPVERATSLPPLEGTFPVALTDQGHAHPAFLAENEMWQTAPPVLSIFPGSSLAPGATALVTAQTPDGPQPLIATERYGQGKVAATLTDSLWRWQLSPGREQPYQRFWNQMVQWLKPAEEEKETVSLDLFADTDQQFLGGAVNLGAVLGGPEPQLLKDVAVTCEVQTPDTRRIPFAMSKQNVTTAAGRTYPGYGLEFTAELPGLHRAVALATIQGKKVESAPYTFYVKPFTPESNPRPANVDLLKALATASGGQFLEPDQAGEVLAQLEFEAGEEQRISYSTLWNTLPMIACLLGLLSVEWAIRKFRNLA